MTSDRPTVPRMFSFFQGRNWPGTRTRAARVRRTAPRPRFRVEELESRWLLSTTAVNLKDASSIPAVPQDVGIQYTAVTNLPPVDDDDTGYVPLEEFARALQLPNAPSVEVKGTHIPGDSPDMLMIPVSGTTGVIKLTLKSATDGQPLVEAIRVVDPWNRELANTTPGPNTMAIDVRLPLWGQNANAVYVQISLGPPGPSKPGTGGGNVGGPGGDGTGNVGDPLQTAFPYVLEVTRVPAPPVPASQFSDAAAFLVTWEQMLASASNSTGANTPPPVVVTVPKTPDPSDSTPTPTPTPTPSVPQDTPGPLPRDPGPDSLPPPLVIPVSVGPLPMRSAAPLGGVLAMSEPTPQVDPHETARAELATFDPTVDPAEVELQLKLAERQVVPMATPGPEVRDESVPLVVMGGPGGLPLLATALIAGPMVAPAETPDTGAQPSAELVFGSGVAPVKLEFTASQAAPVLPMTDHCESPAQPTRIRRAAVLPGVTLALALGVGLMLPDLVAAFQFAPPTRLRVRLSLIRRALRYGLS